MSDTHVETTRRNYFERLAGSFIGMLIGFVLVILAPVLLMWNDGRAVEAERALAAAGRGAVSLASPQPLPANEGKLVHLSGPMTAATPAEVGDIAITAPPALVLRRTVEMYQWTETSRSESKERVGGTQETVTTYTYTKDWSDSQVDSSLFKSPAGHQNPEMPFASMTTRASGARIGGFAIPDGALGQLDPTDLAGEPAGSASGRAFVPEAAPAGWTRTATGLYKGEGTPEAPRVGDVRVRFALVPVDAAVSVLGAQTGTSITAWSPRGSNYDLLKLVPGVVPASAMIEAQANEEAALTWILRIIGTVLCVIAFNLLLGPLKSLANVLPPVAWLVGSASGMAAFALGLGLALISIAIAWFAFRPLLTAGLIIAAVAVVIALKGRRPAAAAAAAAAV